MWVNDLESVFRGVGPFRLSLFGGVLLTSFLTLSVTSRETEVMLSPSVGIRGVNKGTTMSSTTLPPNPFFVQENKIRYPAGVYKKSCDPGSSLAHRVGKLFY